MPQFFFKAILNPATNLWEFTFENRVYQLTHEEFVSLVEDFRSQKPQKEGNVIFKLPKTRIKMEGITLAQWTRLDDYFQMLLGE